MVMPAPLLTLFQNHKTSNASISLHRQDYTMLRNIKQGNLWFSDSQDCMLSVILIHVEIIWVVTPHNPENTISHEMFMLVTTGHMLDKLAILLECDAKQFDLVTCRCICHV